MAHCLGSFRASGPFGLCAFVLFVYQCSTVMQALSSSADSPKCLAQTVDEVTRACSEGHFFPPVEVTNRMLQACKTHQDAVSLHKLAAMLDSPGALKNGDTLASLKDCYQHCPP
jgi:hypothetical protein